MSRLLNGLSLLALAAMMATGGAQAQVAQTNNTPEPAEAAPDFVVVTGFALQNQLSIAQKRETDVAAEFLAADEINRQPDYNIADAFRRAPGVFTIFDEDEGQAVGIRGLNPDFTIAALDGSLIATAQRGNRRVNLEAIPSSAVRRLEIFKSRTADQEGNAIGGTINLVTRSAFDSLGLYAVGSAGVGYTTDQDVPGEGLGRSGDNGVSYRGDFTITNTFMDNTLGFVLSGSYLQRRRDQQRFSASYNAPSVGGVPSVASLLFQGYPNTIERLGGLAKLEFQPNDELFVDFMVSQYTQEDTELRLSHQLNLRGTQTASGPNTVAFPQGQAFVRFNDFFIDKPLFTAQSHLRWSPGDDHVIKAAASFSEATFHEPSNQIQFTTPNNRAELGGSYTFSDTAPRGTLSSTAYFLNPANYNAFQYFTYDQDNDDYVEEYSADYGFNTDRGDTGLGFDAGVQYRNNRRDFDEQRTNYSLAPGVTLTAANFVRDENYTAPYASQEMLVFDAEAFLAYFNANPAQFTSSLANTAADYFFEEDVTAAYGQAVYKADRFKVLAGLRWEKTETLVERQRSQGGVASRVNRTNEYDKLLPSVTGYYDINDSLKLRASYFKSIGRPNPIDLAGSESVTIAGDGTPQLSRGNPDLKAREADSFDASLEYFFPDDAGLLSVAVFNKDIENEIFRFVDEETIDGVLTRVTQPRNVASAKVSGIELSYVQNNLGDLVPALEGFGVSTNFTWFDGAADVVGDNNVKLREADQLLQQPETVLNAAVFYKQGPFETRLTYARSGQSPTGISTSADRFTDRWDEALFQLDWTGRYDVSDNLQLTAEVRNLTNETKSNVLTHAAGDALADYSIYGRTLFVGVAYKY